jgi:hypothetical protein
MKTVSLTFVLFCLCMCASVLTTVADGQEVDTKRMILTK